MTHVVAIEQRGMHAAPMELRFDEIGDGRFAGARQPGEPKDCGLLVLLLGMGLSRHGHAVPMDVGRAPEPMRDHARRGGLVGAAINEDERAHLRFSP